MGFFADGMEVQVLEEALQFFVVLSSGRSDREPGRPGFR
jgi:hypothetical protein